MGDARSSLRRAVPGYVAIVVCLTAAAWAIVDRVDEIGRALDAVSLVDIVLALVFGAAAVFALFLSWSSVLDGSGARLPRSEALTVYGLSQLGKYLPGAIWPVVAQARMGGRRGVPGLHMASASLLALVVSVAAALALGCVLLPFAGDRAVSQFWWAPILAVPLLVGLFPPVLNPALSRLGRLARRPMVGSEINWSSTARAVGWCWLGNLAFGAHLHALGHGVGLEGVRGFLLASSAYALASALGVVVVFVPAGVGVRELVLIVVLGSALTASAALTVALLSRFLLVLVDGALGISRVGRLHRLGVTESWDHVPG